MKEPTQRLAKAVNQRDVSEKLRTAQTGEELIKIAGNAAGTKLDRHDVATTMRNIAQAELERHGFPDWAINSMFLGETVCW